MLGGGREGRKQGPQNCQMGLQHISTPKHISTQHIRTCLLHEWANTTAPQARAHEKVWDCFLWTHPSGHGNNRDCAAEGAKLNLNSRSNKNRAQEFETKNTTWKWSMITNITGSVQEASKQNACWALSRFPVFDTAHLHSPNCTRLSSRPLSKVASTLERHQPPKLSAEQETDKQHAQEKHSISMRLDVWLQGDSCWEVIFRVWWLWFVDEPIRIQTTIILPVVSEIISAGASAWNTWHTWPPVRILTRGGVLRCPVHSRCAPQR